MGIENNRLPTATAAAAALEELVPRSLKVLKAHLGDGDDVNPEAWRAALRLFEHAFGRPREEPAETPLPDDDVDLQSLSMSELEALRRQLLAQRAAEQAETTTLN